MHIEQTGRGPDLFLIHGWMMNGLCWREVVARLRHRYRLTVVDLPGHGNSLRSPYSLCRPEQLCDALIELAPENAAWIGWSLGGLIAQLTARSAIETAPGRIRALVSVGMGARYTAAPDWPCGTNRSLFRITRQLFAISPDRIARQVVARQLSGSQRQAHAHRVLKSLIATPWDKRELTAGLDLLSTADTRHAMRAFYKPVLFLSGERDLIASNTSLKQSSLIAPGGHYIEIPGAGHAPFLSHCTEFITAVDGFISAYS